MKKIVLFIFIVCSSILAFTQETFIVNGVHNTNHNYYAFTNATIYVDYATKMEGATLLIKDGKIVSVGATKKQKLPADVVVYDLKGKYIYPSFIDLYSNYGMPAAKNKKKSKVPQLKSNKKGAFNWNEAIHPEVEAGSLFVVDNKKAEELRKLGFGVVLTHQTDGIMRGTSALVSLANEKANQVMIADEVANHLSFSKGTSTQDYPGSLMGAIALISQTYYDIDWLVNNKEVEEYNISLEALIDNWELPQIFEANDKLNILRADKIGDEFEKQYIFKGKGDEYQRIKEVKATEGSLILPVNFPEAYDVTDAYDALNVSYAKVKNWELAPYNLGIVAKNDIPFAITTADLKEKELFSKNLQKAIKSGLSEQDALKALTYSPAQFIHQYDRVGSLEKGKLANFIITSKNIFHKKNVIHENWIQGKQYIINDYNAIDIRGKYSLNVTGNVYSLLVKGTATEPKGIIQLFSTKEGKSDTTKIDVALKVEGNNIALNFNPNDHFQKSMIRLAGSINYNAVIWDGNGQLATGDWVKWVAIKAKNGVEESDSTKNETIDSLVVPKIQYPNMAYGLDSIPKQETLLIQNATVWTNEAEGILKNTDVLIRDGKIAAIGNNLVAEGATIIDGKGKHLSAGIIDEHSHIAISGGVNECTQAVTAEVSIADVINSDDINIYRQLAGGVVASQLLHGSCNPIGGQSAIIKLKWGSAPEEMKIKGADGFIKFALGENVKQSNWGEFNTIRFPQTRMGVEQVYYDAFIRAKEYEKKWDAYIALPEKEKGLKEAPRIDLELEILIEILNKKRFITCHSYQQSEINMLIHVADSMGFKVNTFTHVLEGYKIVDKIKKHGAGAATFSDWWAYKFEVNDAIPYNGAIMHEQGVVTAFNSDDAEMGRRLNQEAAKAVKYGGVSEEEALKFVTLNPAKLLHLDTIMGSIKVGKDACVVLWSDNPLSVYATVEKTIIDGAIYFDRATDNLMRKEDTKEKARIIEKMIAAKKEGEKTQSVEVEKERLYHCDTVEK